MSLLSRAASRERSNSGEAQTAPDRLAHRDARAMHRSRSSSGGDHRHYHRLSSGGNGGGSSSRSKCNYPGPHEGNEQGVEVVLDSGTSKVVESDTPDRRSSQQVFRGPPPPPPPGPPPPHSAVRPRAMRAPHNGHASMPQTGSFGGYAPGHSSQSHGSHRAGHSSSSHYPNQVGYNPSGSFDQEGPHYRSSHSHQTHYSPQVQYPPHGRHPNDSVNVISPSHREESHSNSHDNIRAPMTPRGRHETGQYRYPPTSPVSRPSSSRIGKPPQPEIRHSRSDGPYAQAQRGNETNSSNVRHPDDGTFNSYTPSQGAEDGKGQGRPPVVAESSFDSSYNHSTHASHPPTPATSHHHYSPHPPTPSSHVSPHGSHYSNSGSHATHYSPHPHTPASGPADTHQQFYGGGSWHSFDSSGAPNPPPPHFDDHRYYGYQANPESPYSSQHHHPHQDYHSPNGQHGGGYYNSPYPNEGRYSDHGHHLSPHHHDDVHPLLKDYHPDSSANPVTPGDKSGDKAAKSASSGIVLPKAAAEIDFEVTQPPVSPVTPPGTVSVCESLSAVNGNDVLCGRGGGTNSQVGNRRFRKLVQEFQPTYLLARRKEKPLLARTIVLIIRKRGGRFLKKDDETGKLFEVGDSKAEAKTSQALREGLDVRATKNAATLLSDKKKKPKKKGDPAAPSSPEAIQASPSGDGGSRPSTPQSDVNITTSKDEEDEDQDQQIKQEQDNRPQKAPPSPLSMPPLDKMNVAGIVHPHSPEGLAFRKRRRMRSKEGAVQPGCCNDKLFMEFCPPRADLHRTTSPNPGDQESMDLNTPPHRNYSSSSRDFKDSDGPDPQPGCVNIAMSAITGAATGSFCLGPTRWRS